MIDAPRQAVLNDLARPPGTAHQRSQGDPGQPVAVVWEGGPGFEADLATVRFVKERASEHRRLYYVTFDGALVLDEQRMPTHFAYVYPVEKHLRGWRVSGGSGGGGDELSVREPWVNLSGGGWPDHFYAGGSVLDAGIEIARVRLTCGNNVVLEDDTAGGVVLFITEQRVELPAAIALYDPAGARVATHEAFGRAPV